jgi:hypothetical protein
MASAGYFLVTSGRSGKQYKVTPSEDLKLVSCECIWYLRESAGKSRKQLESMSHCSHVQAALAYAAEWKANGKRRYVKS